MRFDGSGPALGWDAFDVRRLIDDRPRRACHAAPAAPPCPPRRTLPQPPTRQPCRPQRPIAPLRIIGQVSNTYIIAEGPDGMFLIDQHAAHERVLYEQLGPRDARAAAAGAAVLAAAVLALTARQRAEIEPLLPLLHEVGFDLELVSGRDAGLLVGAVPAMFAKRVSRRQHAGDAGRTAGRQPARPLARPTGDYPGLPQRHPRREGLAPDEMRALVAPTRRLPLPPPLRAWPPDDAAPERPATGTRVWPPRVDERAMRNER